LKPMDATNILSVSDTGEGILPEHQTRIFERFYRADRSRAREVGGTGLGLSIVKHLARLHGGEVRVTSRLTEGSVFSIELPDQ
jgi:signal transduction histidine kinase